MLILLVAVYLGSLALIYAATLVLILAGKSWGQLPHRYVQLLLRLQGHMPAAPPSHRLPTIKRDENARHRILQTEWVHTDPIVDAGCIGRVKSRHGGHGGEFKHNGEAVDIPQLLLDTNLELIQQGIEAIVQDDVMPVFKPSLDYAPSAFAFHQHKHLSSTRHLPLLERLQLRVIFVALWAFRLLVLCPMRFALIVSSFVFLMLGCASALFIDYGGPARTRIAVIYSRIFTAGTGLVARYHDRHNAPTMPGVTISNHLSPNDIQIIAADVDPRRPYLFTVTGQKHSGVIWAIEHFVEKMCPSIWLERTNAEERRRFSRTVLRVAREAGPVLIFPEGYCTNNSAVLQFRKAVFEPEINIHPVAIQQDARLGDNYWSEDKFHHYLMRLLTSLAVVYDVYYLPTQRCREGECSSEFARRVQETIAAKVGVCAVNFDGGIWYKETERTRWRKRWQHLLAEEISRGLAPTPVTSTAEGQGEWRKGYTLNATLNGYSTAESATADRLKCPHGEELPSSASYNAQVMCR